jgi:hypothetical protein
MSIPDTDNLKTSIERTLTAINALQTRVNGINTNKSSAGFEEILKLTNNLENSYKILKDELIEYQEKIDKFSTDLSNYKKQNYPHDNKLTEKLHEMYNITSSTDSTDVHIEGGGLNFDAFYMGRNTQEIVGGKVARRLSEESIFGGEEFHYFSLSEGGSDNEEDDEYESDEYDESDE